MKPPTSRRRARIGDVLEISTPAGLACFQYSRQHRIYGGLIHPTLAELFGGTFTVEGVLVDMPESTPKRFH